MDLSQKLISYSLGMIVYLYHLVTENIASVLRYLVYRYRDKHMSAISISHSDNKLPFCDTRNKVPSS